jgi:hypothetical protein
MNTKNKQNPKKQLRQKQESKKQRQNADLLHNDRKPHEQEHPETRLTR